MIPVDEISRRLADRTDAVCNYLINGWKQAKTQLWCGSVHGGEGDSLKVDLEGHHRGKWKDWANQEHRGDLLDLWRLSKNLSHAEAIKQAKEYLGIHEPPVKASPKVYAKPPEVVVQAPEKGGAAYEWLTETRKIKPDILQRYKVEVDVKKRCIIFPCYDPSGVLMNRGYRALPKKNWQDEGARPTLFGWHAIPQESYDSRTILITEGQQDALTWAQWGFPALSVPNGTGMSWMDEEWDNLQCFDRFYLAFDMDPTGREITEKTVKRLGAMRCYIVNLPKPYKDANEALMAGVDAETASKWVKNAEAPKINGLVAAGELRTRLMAEIAVKPEPYTLKFLRKTWPYSGLYFRPSEVTLWTGHSHAGKSTFLRYLTVGILSEKSNGGIFVANFEEMPETTLRKCATATLASLGMQRNEDGFNSWLIEFGDRIFFADKVGYISADALFEMMRFAFHRYGVNSFVVDSLMRIEGLEEDFPAQGAFMNRSQEFVKETGTHLHLVVHPRKTMNGNRPGLQDIKGSSLIYNNADNIVVVARNNEKLELSKERELTEEEQKWHDTEIVVEKQRESGWCGAFYLKFNAIDYTYRECAKAVKPKPEKQQKSGYKPGMFDKRNP